MTDHVIPTDLCELARHRVEIEYVASDDDVSRRDQTVQAIHFENDVTVRDLREAVPGIDGDVRVLHRAVARALVRSSRGGLLRLVSPAPLQDIRTSVKIHDSRL